MLHQKAWSSFNGKEVEGRFNKQGPLSTQHFHALRNPVDLHEWGLGFQKIAAFVLVFTRCRSALAISISHNPL